MERDRGEIIAQLAAATSILRPVINYYEFLTGNITIIPTDEIGTWLGTLIEFSKPSEYPFYFDTEGLYLERKKNDVTPSTVPLHQLSGFPVSSRNARRQQLNNERRGVSRNPPTRGRTRNSEGPNLARNAGLRGNPVATAVSPRTVAQQQNPHHAEQAFHPPRNLHLLRLSLSLSEITGPRNSVLPLEGSSSGDISSSRGRSASPGASTSPEASASHGASTSRGATTRGAATTRGRSASPDLMTSTQTRSSFPNRSPNGLSMVTRSRNQQSPRRVPSPVATTRETARGQGQGRGARGISQ
ncbi:unnamed protein product [Caenorhabditis brenneri]